MTLKWLSVCFVHHVNDHDQACEEIFKVQNLFFQVRNFFIFLFLNFKYALVQEKYIPHILILNCLEFQPNCNTGNSKSNQRPNNYGVVHDYSNMSIWDCFHGKFDFHEKIQLQYYHTNFLMAFFNHILLIFQAK